MRLVNIDKLFSELQCAPQFLQVTREVSGTERFADTLS